MSSSLVSCRYVCNPCNAIASASCAPRPFRPLPSASRTNSSIAFARYIFILHPPPFVPLSFSLRVRMSSYHASSTYLDLSRKYHISRPVPVSRALVIRAHSSMHPCNSSRLRRNECRRHREQYIRHSQYYSKTGSMSATSRLVLYAG